MCGIAGVIHYSANGMHADTLVRTAEILKHRGPDGLGFAFHSFEGQTFEATTEEFLRPGLLPVSHLGGLRFQAGLMHRRLSIIQPGPDGHQPMPSENRNVWLTFNGEIYNYLQINKELESEGVSFATLTDTEVLLKAYLHWGKSMVNKLDGMWSFAILDIQNRELFASVDRSGIKPFYFTANNQRFSFASEIKALTQTVVSPSPNWPRVYRFLATGQSEETTEAEWETTLFTGVFRLRAGEQITVPLEQGPPKVTRWHHRNINLGFDFQPFRNEKRRVEEIRELLVDMIGLRLQADVPLGICLSGGIDSSTIAGLTTVADQASGKNAMRKAFMATLPKGHPNDESDFARIMARQAGFSFHEVQPTAQDFMTSLDDFVYTSEEPVPGMNAFSQYAVFRKVSESGIRVTLDGQGADELFGGYFQQQQVWAWECLLHGKAEPIALKWLVKNGMLRLSAHWFHFLELRLHPARSWLRPEVFSTEFAEPTTTDALNGRLYHDFTSATLPFLLKAADRNSMRWSVESRMPFTDFEPIIQYLFAIEGAAKIQNGKTKYLLRKAAEPFVPEFILGRKDKIGFAAPQQEWLRHFPSDTLHDLLQAEHHWLNKAELLRYIHKANQNGGKLPPALWRTLSVLLWVRRMVDGVQIA